MNSNGTKTKTNRIQKRRSFRRGLSRLFFLSVARGRASETLRDFLFFLVQNFYSTSRAWLNNDKIIMLRVE